MLRFEGIDISVQSGFPLTHLIAIAFRLLPEVLMCYFVMRLVAALVTYINVRRASGRPFPDIATVQPLISGVGSRSSPSFAQLY